MRIAGLVRTSLVDYPGCIAAVVFTQGCNLRCGYCHNPSLLPMEGSARLIAEAEVIDYLNRRKGVLDGLVITGGEPTLQSGLDKFIINVKELRFKVKLDTNGTNPLLLKELIAARLLDYVAMDLKAPPERYREICGKPVDLAAIRESVRLLQCSTIPYEFRTTLAPGLKSDDLRQIINWAGEKIVFQKYRPVPNQPDPAIAKKPIAWETVMELQRQFGFCRLRGFSA